MYNFFSTNRIPGIPMIGTTDNYFFKFLWTILILISIAVGFYNIAEVKNDYYNFDVITNIERVTPDNVTFPAITICTDQSYERTLFINGLQRTKESILIKNDNISRFKNFILQMEYSDTSYNVTNQMDYFKIPDFQSDCLRFNGFTNHSKLVITNNSLNMFYISLKNYYDEIIFQNSSRNEVHRYSLFDNFRVFVTDNYLNSFEKVLPLLLQRSKSENDVKIEMSSIESKLGEPYNSCKESPNGAITHQMNCLEACVLRETKTKYNCTFLNTLFSVGGVRECSFAIKRYRDEFTVGCKEECPENCNSKLFTLNFNTIPTTSSETHFYFAIPQFTTLKITQIPKMNVFSYICAIGGALGLFMGISFLNIVEIIEFIIDVSSLAFIR